MSCQEEKKMLRLICFLFQESQQSSGVANELDSVSCPFSHPCFFQIRPKKEKTSKEKKNGSGHKRWRGGLSQQQWFTSRTSLCLREEGFSARNTSHREMCCLGC